MCELVKLLFKPYRAPIRGVAPLVPSTWTGDPTIAPLQPIAACFPDPLVVTQRLSEIIKAVSAEEGVTCTNGKKITNPKPLEDLCLKPPSDFSCQLIRDYNGEYAPCIAAALGGAVCRIEPCFKPASMRATLDEVETKAGLKGNAKVSLSGSPADESRVPAWIAEKISKSGVNTQYYEAEGVKREALGARLFAAADLGFTVKGKIQNPISMNSLHNFWLANQIPQRFCEKVHAWSSAQGLTSRNLWGRSLCAEAPLAERNKPPPKPSEHSAPVESTATVKPPETISFALWIRWQLPQNHSHNMGQDLLREIVTAIAHVCEHVYPQGTIYQFLLFGDRAARKTPSAKEPELITFGDLPIHTGAKGAADKTPIPDFIADLFLAQWQGVKPYVRVVDFRDLYNPTYFTTPTLDAFKDEELVQLAKEKPQEAVARLKGMREKAPRKAGYSYWEQYSFFQFVDAQFHPRFIIGAESGNMDGFGYCGIPVLSVDVEDTAATDESVLTDRIAQYSLLTPLWNVLNYHRGGSLATFRRHLYGAVLMYTEYAGELHTTKRKGSLKDIKVISTLDELGSLAELYAKSVDADEVYLAALKELYNVVDVLGDGNCLFRALSRGRTPAEDRHVVYRQQAVDYAARHFDLVMINSGAHAPFDDRDDYKSTLRVAALNAQDELHYGGFVEIEAFALANGLSVEVYSSARDVNNPIVANPGKAEVVRILYVNRNHYKALLPK